MFRFDGIRAVLWKPPAGQHLPDNYTLSLLAALAILALLEDHKGTLWVGTAGFNNDARLCAIHNGSLQCYGEEGTFGLIVNGLYEDAKGTLWVGVQNGLWRWRPDSPQFYSLPGNSDGIRAFAEDDDGALLIGTRTGIRRFVGGRTESYPLSFAIKQIDLVKMFRDRDGSLWIATDGMGLLHEHDGRTDRFAQSDGLSDDNALSLFEDQEGSIWVTTLSGLDRFRDLAVATISVKQGLSNALIESVLADKDGSIWLGTANGLYRWDNGRIATFDMSDGKLNGLNPNSLFQDSNGRIWVSTRREFGYLENNRFIAIRDMPGGPVHGIAEDKTGNLWTANQNAGLFQLSGGKLVHQIPWATLGHKDPAWSLAVDPSLGGPWVVLPISGMAKSGHPIRLPMG